LSDLAFNGIPLALAEGTVRSYAVDLVSTNHLRIVTMATPIGNRLTLKVFSLVVGIITQAIEEGESLAGDRD
jgi:hypothetical protein